MLHIQGSNLDRYNNNDQYKRAFPHTNCTISASCKLLVASCILTSHLWLSLSFWVCGACTWLRTQGMLFDCAHRRVCSAVKKGRGAGLSPSSSSSSSSSPYCGLDAAAVTHTHRHSIWHLHEIREDASGVIHTRWPLWPIIVIRR
jgi:hypothetical protein